MRFACSTDRFLAALLAVPAAMAQYAGSGACKPCHSEIFAKQRATGHARALAKAAPGDRGEWAFGAGAKAITWVSHDGADSYLEHGLSFYPATKSTALTPGHTDANGRRYRTLDPQATALRCFRCHSTGPLRLEAERRIAPFELGAGCESCHGHGSAHVQGGGGKGSIFVPSTLAPAALNEYCGACHRKAEDIADWSRSWNVRHQPAYLSQSVCFRVSGKLSCLTCHDPHGALETKAAVYDAKCATCHPQVRHRTPVAARSCVGCHMPMVRTNANLRFANHWIGVYGAGGNLVPQRRRSAPEVKTNLPANVLPPADPSFLLPLFERAAAENPDSARAASDLGLFLRSIGQSDRAVEALKRAAGLERSPPALESLADALASHGQVREAFPLFAEAAEGADPAVAARSLVAMANVDEVNAADHLRRALAHEEKASGKDHARVALILNNLALALRARGRNQDAEPPLRRALAIQEKASGPNHPAVGSTLSNLGNLLEATGRATEAEAALRRAVRIFEQRIGPETAELAIACTNLANLVSARGANAEAIALLRRTLRIDESIHGPEHPEVASDLENLASLLAETGSRAEAERLLARARRIKGAATRP